MKLKKHQIRWQQQKHDLQNILRNATNQTIWFNQQPFQEENESQMNRSLIIME